MKSVKQCCQRTLCAAATLTVALATPTSAQELLPAVNFRAIANIAGEQWPADFNGDGITDLVGHSQDTGAVKVVLGNGDGTFRAPIVSSTVGSALGTGDFNRDGAVDVVAWSNNTIVILPGNRTGALGSPHTVVEMHDVLFLNVADMNGDGNRDLVVGQDGYAVYVIPGNGNFTFGPSVTLTSGARPHGAAIADFNHDTRPDIAVANAYERRLVIFYNRGGLLFTSLDVPIDRSSTDITARDLNGDGHIDLVVSARQRDDGPWEDGYVYVYHGDEIGGFALVALYGTAKGTHSVVLGDFTHDGRLDIATSNRTFSYFDLPCGANNFGPDSVSILPGKSDGTFGPATTFTIDPTNRLDEPPINKVGSLNTSDLNRDGFPDLVVGLGTVFLTAAPRANRPPTAFAGEDKEFYGDWMNLFGSGSDPDSHFLSFTWDDAGAGGEFINQWADSCYSNYNYGTFTVTLTAHDGHGGTGSDSAQLTHPRPNEIPEVEVQSPTQGEVLTANTPYTIRWQASDFDGLREIDVSFAVDGGRFEPIAECTNLPGSARTCTWNRPGPATEGGRILVVATDTTGLEGGDSTGAFAIRTAGGGDALPEGWNNRDVGGVGAAGSASYDSGTFTVRGSGADIWGTADEFHWAYTAMTGDFDVIARVRSVQNVNQWTKAGIMIRAADPGAGAMHASLFATPTTAKGVAFQRRRDTNGQSVHTSGPATTSMVWLRLTRFGRVVYASYRKATTDPWTRITSDSVSLDDPTVLVGLAVSSHVDGTVATAQFDNVSIDAIPDLSRHQDIGAVGVAGQTSSSGPVLTIEGSGADIWGTADAFHYLYAPLHGNGSVTARVLSIENTHAWAKAGVMFRESLDANAKQVMVVVSPGKGVAMQYRATTGGVSANVSLAAGRAPRWLRLTRAGNVFTGETSVDGETWTSLGSVTIPMAQAINAGIPVTSHNNTTRATVVVDEFFIRK